MVNEFEHNRMEMCLNQLCFGCQKFHVSRMSRKLREPRQSRESPRKIQESHIEIQNRSCLARGASPFELPILSELSSMASEAETRGEQRRLGETQATGEDTRPQWIEYLDLISNVPI